MSIIDRLVQLRTVAVAVIGFIRRHPRASIAAAVALVILGPLLTGSGGGAFFLNLAGLGFAALVVRRVMRISAGRRAQRSRRHRRQQQAAAQQQAQGGTP